MSEPMVRLWRRLDGRDVGTLLAGLRHEEPRLAAVDPADIHSSLHALGKLGTVESQEALPVLAALPPAPGFGLFADRAPTGRRAVPGGRPRPAGAPPLGSPSTLLHPVAVQDQHLARGLRALQSVSGSTVAHSRNNRRGRRDIRAVQDRTDSTSSRRKAADAASEIAYGLDRAWVEALVGGLP
ncbi:hypothetical protein [Streptomyces mirabilis]|uniref:hypothetical protein n=1 Tax=Streptomyces mirabilis TaxID=68239 RepID=UPI00380B4E96